jgi:hypothetical protein
MDQKKCSKIYQLRVKNIVLNLLLFTWGQFLDTETKNGLLNNDEINDI